MTKTQIRELLYPPVCSNRGAPMGRIAVDNRERGGIGTMHAHRVRFVDGDYDIGGAYWGGGSPLYCVWALHRDGSGLCWRSFHRVNSASAAKREACRQAGATL